MTIEDVILSLLNARTQLHVWHWQTRGFAEHKALGKLYAECGDAADAMAEAWMGANDEAVKFAGITPESLSDYEKLYIDDYLIRLANNLISLEGVGTDILNMRDDILGKVNKTRYLLTLT